LNPGAILMMIGVAQAPKDLDFEKQISFPRFARGHASDLPVIIRE